MAGRLGSTHGRALMFVALLAVVPAQACTGDDADRSAVATSVTTTTPSTSATGASTSSTTSSGGSSTTSGATSGSHGSATTAPPGSRTVPPGSWGGKGLGLTVVADGATAQFDCAAGVIEEPLRTDADGRFAVAGSYRAESGGPPQTGSGTEAKAARYAGRVDGSRLSITVTLAGDGSTIGTFVLVRSQPPTLDRCG